MKNLLHYLSITILLFCMSSVFGQTVVRTSFYSDALERTNLVSIYLPPDYDEAEDIYYPVIYFMHGWGGSENSAETIIALADELITEGTISPLILVCANNSPSPFLGSFFVNSSLNGDYEDFNTVDLINWVESNYMVSPEKNHRSLMGQSMGGYGCFRYGVEHKDLFRGFAAHGSAVNFDVVFGDIADEVFEENEPGPPYFYNVNNGLFTKFIFAMSGAFSPNENTPQDYIYPPIVEFPLNANGEIIEDYYSTYQDFDPVHGLSSLSSTDSVAILFGAGQNDELHLFDPNSAVKDTLDALGLDYEFYDHNGSHGMPVGFKNRALIFLDSIMQIIPEQDPDPDPDPEPTFTSEVAKWLMNEGAGNTAFDSSVNDNDGSLLNGTTWSDGKYSYGLQFDGIDDKVYCGTDESLNIGIGDFTIATWINLDPSQTTYPTILAKGAGASYDIGYWLIYRYNRLWLYISDGTKRHVSYSASMVLNNSAWNHIAVVIDRDAEITFYFNGEAYGTSDATRFEGEYITSEKELSIGMWQTSTNTALKGILDNTTLFNEALSVGDIESLYTCETTENSPPVIVEAASASPTTVIFPGTTTLSVSGDDPDDDVLTYSWVQLTGSGDVAFTANNSSEAFSTEASFTETGNYDLRVYVTDGIDSVSSDVAVEVIEYVIDSEEVSQWPMNESEGTTTADVAGGNHGIIFGGAEWVEGNSGSAVNFDGVNDKIDCGNSTSMDIGKGDFTIATWLKMDNTQNTYPTIVAKGGGAAYDKGYWLIVRSGRLWLYISDGVTRKYTYSNSVNITDNKWHHIATVIDRDDVITFYVDGEKAGTFDVSAFRDKNITSTKSFTIGAWGSSAFSFLDGTIDNTQLFNTTLSQSEIIGIMNNGTNSEPVDNHVLSDWNIGNNHGKIKSAAINNLENEFSLSAYPNPFHNEATIKFTLNSMQNVTVRIYDMKGTMVTTLLDGIQNEGTHSIVWNGQNLAGRTINNGIYIIKIYTADGTDQILINKFR